ncbi:hypothetical protein V6N13_083214 [Hibiscus sabdariffa]
MEEVDSSEENHGGTDVVEQRHGGKVKDVTCDDGLEGNVLPLSFLSKPLNSGEKTYSSDGGMDGVEQRHGSEGKDGTGIDGSEGTVIPNSLLYKSFNSREVERMWEENKVEDWRVMETNSWIAKEDIGLIHRDEEQRCSAVNLSD